MAALSLWQPILDAPFFREIASRLERGEKGLRLTGLVAGSRALVLGMLAAHTGRPLMLVVPDDAAVEEFQRDLSAVAGLIGKAPRLVVMPALDTDPYAEFPPHPEVIRERVVALDRLQRDDVDILIRSNGQLEVAYRQPH